MLDLVLGLPNLLLHLRLEAVRGTFPWGGYILMDDEESAGC